MTRTIKVNTVTTESGSTLTLGGCGKTVALASGASQTGFGRTGTVDWQTTKKTTDFTTVNGEGYFVDTGSGVVTATLPASPSPGNIVYIKDYDGNFSTNKCIVARNGSNIRGATNNIDLQKNNAGAVFIYVDATEGWQVFFDGSDSDASPVFICATGGTETNDGNFRVHTFTGPGTFTVNCVSDTAQFNDVDYVIVGGGGAGGSGGFGEGGGGGGAGGYRESPGTATCYTASPRGASPATAVTVTAAAFPIVVGGGGSGGVGPGGCGVASSFNSITGAGGGGAGGQFSSPQSGRNGKNGGSGGAGASQSSGGTGNSPPVNPVQGTDGGSGSGSPAYSAGGGGGATAAGTSSSPSSNAGAGGAGATSGITGANVARAGGGGGSAGQASYPCGGAGGAGGGGAGTNTPQGGCNGGAGTANTGGGGGGGGKCNPPTGIGGNGGSGVVIIRYRKS